MELLTEIGVGLVAFHHTGTAGFYFKGGFDEPREKLFNGLADEVAKHFGYDTRARGVSLTYRDSVGPAITLVVSEDEAGVVLRASRLDGKPMTAIERLETRRFLDRKLKANPTLPRNADVKA